MGWGGAAVLLTNRWWSQDLRLSQSSHKTFIFNQVNLKPQYRLWWKVAVRVPTLRSLKLWFSFPQSGEDCCSDFSRVWWVVSGDTHTYHRSTNRKSGWQGGQEAHYTNYRNYSSGDTRLYFTQAPTPKQRKHKSSHALVMDIISKSNAYNNLK